ncbi:MAG: radical SAM protein [Desulfobacterales bacterium]|nr:radical SAM protein [Desulfobacterales bacterium]
MSAHFLFIHVNLLAHVESPDTIPISEATILAYLKSHGFSGQILGDFANTPLKPSVLAKAINSYQPLAIGFTAYQENIEQIRLWARLAKKMSPAIKIIIGGPQATFMPAEGLRHMPEVDLLCRGEGEDVMLGLARALSKGTDIARVPGLCFLREDEVIETGPAYGANDLDTYPSAYLMDIIDLRCKERAVMLTSRGCSYDCAFCYTPRASRRKVRFYSSERIIEEMKYLKSKGIGAFWFADTNFSFSRKRLVAMLEAIIREAPGITFWCQTRYDLVTPELLSLLRRAGADNVAFGLESANTPVLEKINKSIDLERLSEVIRLTHEAGINVELFSMFGLPGETFDQALATLAFVKRNRVAVDGNSISQQAHLFFGTPMNEDPAAYGIRPLRRTRPAYLSMCRDYETDAMSADEIRRMSLIWRLNHNDFAEDVQVGRNLFHRAGFITQNRHTLAGRPGATCLLARIYLALEEYGAASDCMKLLSKEFPDDPAVRELLTGRLLCFKVSRETARPGFKVIYDCQGSVDGRPVPATYGRFQEAVIGQGMLLPEFERHFEETGQGEYSKFDMAFPDDYPQRDLAGRIVTFRVHVHHTMEPVTVKNYKDLDEQVLLNEYDLEDTEGLRQHNINLCYKALRGAALRGRALEVTDSLTLMNLYLKLGFVDRAAALISKLPENRVVLTHAAHLYRMNARPQKALELLDRVGQDGPRERLIRAQALFDVNRLEESEASVKDMKLPNDMQLADLRVQLAAELPLPIETFLEREEALLDAKIQAMFSGDAWGV